MTCDHCHDRPATMVITQNVEGKSVKVYLCEICAIENEAYLAQNNPFQQFMGAVFEQKSNQETKTIKCPNCGMSIEEFRKSSKIGCYLCYHTFEGYFKSIFKQIHGSTRHVGKRPEKLDKKLKKISQLNSLQLLLQEAISIEDYEKAAKLRDEIRALKATDEDGEL